MGASYDGRAAVHSISREGVTQKSCRVTATQSIIQVMEQSACFSHGGVTAFTECRVTGVLLYRIRKEVCPMLHETLMCVGNYNNNTNNNNNGRNGSCLTWLATS